MGSKASLKLQFVVCFANGVASYVLQYRDSGDEGEPLTQVFMLKEGMHEVYATDYKGKETKVQEYRNYNRKR